MSFGSCPTNRFWDRIRVWRLAHLYKNVGNSPGMLLYPRSRVVRFLRSQTDGGISREMSRFSREIPVTVSPPVHSIPGHWQWEMVESHDCNPHCFLMSNRISRSEAGDCEITKMGREVRRRERKGRRIVGNGKGILDIFLLLGRVALPEGEIGRAHV